jgi:PleD family two-component response regulator
MTDPVEQGGDLILIADDDRDIVRFVEVNLKLEGFRVATAHDGDDALAKALSLSPDLVLLDVMMPRMDGYEVCSRLRADPRSAHIPVIMLTAKSLSADKVLGLTAGADDYIIKPFDPMELVARAKATLARAREQRALSPQTGLPSDARTEDELRRRIEAGVPFAVVSLDADDFAAFNARYGQARGDDAIALIAQVLGRAVDETAGPDGFVGHRGGDDFLVLLPPRAAEDFARRVVAGFDMRIPSLYDAEDAAVGAVELVDRQGRLHRVPIMTLSLGLALAGVPGADPAAVVEQADRWRAVAKRDRRSTWAGGPSAAP